MRFLLILLILFLKYGAIQGQPYTINYSSQDGLPGDNVTCINEDHHGYIWVGTSSGIVKFDGVNFLKKGWQGKGEQPKEVYVKEILFDELHNLWISTERNGIFHQNIFTKFWTNFTNNKTDSNYISSNEIYDIELYENKLYYSCSECGISYIDINNLIPKTEEILINSSIKKYCSSLQNKQLLVGTRNSVYSILQQSGQSSIDTLFHHYPNLDLTDINLDAENQIWITDYAKGIFLYDGSVKNLKDKNPKSFVDKWKYKLIFTSQNDLWLLVPNLGIAHKKEKGDSWHLFTPQPFDSHSLPKATFTSIFESKNGVIWVSSTKGLSYIHPDYQGFEYIPDHKEYTDYLLDAKFDRQTSKYVLSYASPQDRIKIFDPYFNRISTLNHAEEDKRMLSIFELIPYADGFLALGNFIYYLNAKTETITKINLPGLSNNISPLSAFISQDDLWIYTTNNSLIHYSLLQAKVLQEIKIPIFNTKPYPFYLVHQIEDFGEYIGVSAESVFALVSKLNGSVQLYDLDLNSGKIHKIDTHPDNSGTITQSIYLGNGDFYLVSKGEGLHKAHLDLASLDISLVNTLTPDELYSPVEVVLDSNEKLWIATDNGLALASKNLDLLKKITSSQGLSNCKLAQGLSLVKDKIILNGASGIIVGDTAVLAKKYVPVSVDITSAALSGIDLLHFDKHKFDYDKNNLEITVSTPLYANRESYTYAFRLVNHSKEWTIQSLKNNTIHYENLPPGTYIFEIKAIVNDQDGKISRIHFEIAFPFWQTWWFLILCCIVIFALLYMLYKNRLRNKLANERLNTQMAELKNEAIRAQLNPHFIFNALNSIRSMILLDKKEESIDYLGHFSSMVRDILSLSKEQSIPLSKEIEFNKKYIEIEQLRFSQQFSYHISVDPNIDVTKIKVPPLLLQPYIENAIWHGLLHNEGEAILKVDISTTENMLTILIDDNGIGRKASEKLKSGLQTKTRKGYGEILSAQRIHILGDKAEIKIDDKSKNGKPDGTLVTIKIPLEYE